MAMNTVILDLEKMKLKYGLHVVVLIYSHSPSQVVRNGSFFYFQGMVTVDMA